MSGVFEAIKRHVDIRDAATRHYGIEVDRHGKSLCFVHAEKTSSLSFKGGRFKCFGCGIGGSVIDLVCHMRGIQPLEAARELDSLYGLGLFDKPPNAQEIRQQMQQREAARRQTGRL